MSGHLEHDLDALKQLVLSMGGLVEKALEEACSVLTQRERPLDGRAADLDERIDRLQLEVDDSCLKILALHQPVASDLRFVTSAMKIVNDLERIGDLAVNIAQRSAPLVGKPVLDEPLGFDEMMSITSEMLRGALDAFVASDPNLARGVLARDDEVDALNRDHFEVLQARMKRDPEAIDRAVSLLSISRNLERTADLATNIAEDVVFLVEAVDIRHPGLAKRSRPTGPDGA